MPGTGNCDFRRADRWDSHVSGCTRTGPLLIRVIIYCQPVAGGTFTIPAAHSPRRRLEIGGIRSEHE